MKKTATILLLGIFLFNWVGYRLLTSYMEDKANARLESQLDNGGYDESQLISIKIPATHLSYYTNSKFFDRVDGHIEIKGVKYNYVKSRLYNDSLELLCIPNHSLMRIQNAKDDFFKLVNDLQHTGQNKKADNHAASAKSFSAEYCNDYHLFNLNNLYFSISKKIFHFSSATTFYFSSVIENPPEYC